MVLPKLVIDLKRPNLVLLMSGMFRSKLDHQGTSSGRCVPAGHMLHFYKNFACKGLTFLLEVCW